jgi:1-acyl-sn-glycerol-3-phosphate acyltransferase
MIIIGLITLLWYAIVISRIWWEESKVGWPIMIYHRLIPYTITHLTLSTLQLFYLIPFYICGYFKYYHIMQHIGYNFAFCIRVFWGNLKITGIENIPKEKAIWIGNHQSIVDMGIMSYLPCETPLVGTAKSSIKFVPASGLIAILSKTILIDRKDKNRANTFFRNAVGALENGNSINIYPQGTRKYGDPPLPFKYGAFNLSAITKIPIVPYKISYDIPNSNIYLEFFPNINPKEESQLTPTLLMEKTYNTIYPKSNLTPNPIPVGD